MFLPTDRSVQFPNRYQLAPVAGTDNIADLTPAPGEVSDPGTLWNRQAARQMQADLRTLPIAPGYSVSAGDVVDVSGGEAVKTDESSTAIALQSGTAGQSIECIFSGTTNASFVSEGQVIDSHGVYGVGIMDGILQVWSKERPGVVTGTYFSSTTVAEIELGFSPTVVFMYGNSNYNNQEIGVETVTKTVAPAAIPRIINKTSFHKEDGYITENGFVATLSRTGVTLHYVAFK